MKRYNPGNPDEFREMERLAYNGNAPLNGLPPPAYQYFAKLEIACRMFRTGQIDKSQLADRRRKLLQQYKAYTEERKKYCETFREYQANIRAAQESLVQIEKSHTAQDIAKYACACIEHLTGEIGFCARQMKKIGA